MTHIAHVGAFKRMSDADRMRWMMALTWLLDHGLFPDRPKHEAINLKYGRDFLAEHHRYDIVVMHDIFWPGPAGMEHPVIRTLFSGRSPKDRELIKTSPLASEKKWCERLIETEAKHIFVFETSPACVNAWKLGDLPGYTMPHIDTTFGVYVRQ